MKMLDVTHTQSATSLTFDDIAQKTDKSRMRYQSQFNVAHVAHQTGHLRALGSFGE